MSRRRNIGYDVLHDLLNSGTMELFTDHGQVKTRFADPDKPLRVSGIGNESLRQYFSDRLFELSDDEFVREAEQYIWLAAYAANNPNSDYHWMATVCYYEGQRRGNPELYKRAWKQASGTV